MIEPTENAIDGNVATLPSYDPFSFPLGSVILCRNTAPLVRFTFSLTHRNIPCSILGRDIGATLVTLVKKIAGPSPIDYLEFLRRLSLWREREVNRAYNESRSPEFYYDQAQCLGVFCNAIKVSFSVALLLSGITSLFTDANTNGFSRRITLSTIHKAKGLEFPSVFILDRELLPSRYAIQPWQRIQERNLHYVAVTRAKDSLFYIQSDCWKS